MEVGTPTQAALIKEGRCGAKKRLKGGYCRGWPVKGRKRCRLHGGLTPVGDALPQYKHGRYSRHLPEGIRERVAEMTSDPDLLSLRDEIGVVGALTASTLEGIDLGAALHAAASMRAHLRAFQTARAKSPPDVRAMQDAIRSMEETSAEAGQAAEAVDRALDLLERRRRLVDTERRRLEAMSANITVAEAYRMVDALMSIVAERVHDPHVLTQIARDFEIVLSSRPGYEAGSGETT